MRKLLLSLLAMLLLLEEWLWNHLTLFSHQLSVWLHLKRFENWLRASSAKVCLAAFAFPVILILPAKVMVLVLFANGHIILAITLLILSKLLATLIMTRMFAVSREKLMSIVWFASLYRHISEWLEWAHTRIQQTDAYQQAVRLKQLASNMLRRWRAGGV